MMYLVIKASVILIGAFLATFAMRRASASVRRLVWIVAAACLLLLPVLSLVAPALPTWTPAATVSRQEPANKVVAAASTLVVAAKSPARALPWLLMIWAAGAAAVLGRLAIGMARMSWLANAAQPIQEPEGAVDLRTRIGVRRVRFLQSHRIAMPMTSGVVRPVILLPQSSREWPAERLRLVVAHELIHVQQRDCFLQILMQIVCAIYWFHPLMWLAAAQFRKERERSCDDGVLRLGIDGPEYAGHLLQLVRTLKPGARPAIAVAMAHQSHLESRLVALLDANVNRRKLSRKAVVLVILAAAGAVLPLASVRAQAPSGTGTISGVVYDASGAVVPRATVLATNLDTHAKETALANPAGEYTLRSIPAGHYMIDISSAGFKIFHRSNMLLNANENQRLDVTLELGNITERLEVVGQRPAGQFVVPSTPRRIRVGGNVTAAKLITKIDPVYPESARQKGIEGPVMMQAVISKEGNVLSLTVVTTADPDLAKAATDAVRQWRYEPTLLNGEPVEVVTTITVDFKLN